MKMSSVLKGRSGKIKATKQHLQHRIAGSLFKKISSNAAAEEGQEEM